MNGEKGIEERTTKGVEFIDIISMLWKYKILFVICVLIGLIGGFSFWFFGKSESKTPTIQTNTDIAFNESQSIAMKIDVIARTRILFEDPGFYKNAFDEATNNGLSELAGYFADAANRISFSVVMSDEDFFKVEKGEIYNVALTGVDALQNEKLLEIILDVLDVRLREYKEFSLAAIKRTGNHEVMQDGLDLMVSAELPAKDSIGAVVVRSNLYRNNVNIDGIGNRLVPVVMTGLFIGLLLACVLIFLLSYVKRVANDPSVLEKFKRGRS